MTTTRRPLRLGVGLPSYRSVAELLYHARRAEEIGIDVLLLPDHLGHTAPLPPLVTVAQAAPSLRVSNLVINAAFYRPALLARDLASVDALTGGRLEIGLGAGYAEEEFIAAGVPFPSAGERVRLLAEHVTTIRALLSDPEFAPGLVQTPPPILVAGAGDRLLAMAARHADIVSILSMGTEADLAERVAYVKEQAGDRIDRIELGFGFFQVSMDDADDLSMVRQLAPGATDASLRKLATLLDGPVEAAAGRIRRFHEELGIGYVTLTKTDGTSWETFGKLVAAIRD